MSKQYRKFTSDDYAYFITCKVINRVPILAIDRYRKIVIDALAELPLKKNISLNGFVIMPSHLHAILWPGDGIRISDLVRAFKAETSQAIAREAASQNDREILAVLSTARQRQADPDTLPLLWQESSHPEAVFTEDYAREKLAQIHMNPVRAKLVSAPQDWLYSSAQAYILGKNTYPPIDVLNT